ncbi:S-layer homology domain-containing protein [Patescibacteria group bacterium]|nr:S-layer homology domain-containing protein [Patescibacteria group bacterium]MBU1703702.1 S-layer homology domain-containing protein [Patescibacteria group bacterium]MBU1954259.1 S-layer homology domain-containing protein [Patescibacteria group bacterium]
MRKKLVIALALILIPVAVMAQAFPDVPEGSSYFGAVEYLKSKGVISGYPDGTFKPDQSINRAEALKMVMIAAGTQQGNLGDLTFSDVNADDWFSEYVHKGVSKGIVEGYDDGTFRPDTNINIAESLKIIFLSFGVDLGAAPTVNPYPDVDMGGWYARYAQYAKNRQFIWPMGDGKLHAEKDISRGEFADIIYRFMYSEENGLQKFPLSTDWPTYSDAAGGYSVKIPFDWERIKAETQTIFWKKDLENNQLSWARIFPNGATMVIAVDENTAGLSLQNYLSHIEYDSKAVIQSQTLNTYPFTSVYIADTSTFDYYFELPSGKILAVYSQTGEGLNKPQLIEEIRNIVGSIRYFEGSPEESAAVTDNEQFLAQIRANILVKGGAENMMALFDDLVLIETDAIGIGTGPVDYHYSQAHNVTLKVERNSKTILAITEEKSTSF